MNSLLLLLLLAIPLYLLLLLLVRYGFIVAGYRYRSCPHCSGNLHAFKRDRKLFWLARLTFRFVSFRKVICLYCNYEGFRLRSFFRRRLL